MIHNIFLSNLESLKRVFSVDVRYKREINWQCFQTQAFTLQLQDHLVKHNPVAPGAEVQTVPAIPITKTNYMFVMPMQCVYMKLLCVDAYKTACRPISRLRERDLRKAFSQSGNCCILVQRSITGIPLSRATEIHASE